ncbi:unnamed protein product [Schistocephalus solidus]|uniref:Uncharacterized protein n=1 Tax=Schistocephalus solidus TaxID=70667 RepID=A0A183T707_SCHSO|nr:unnamed protein product [Schistocephalus solidus]
MERARRPEVVVDTVDNEADTESTLMASNFERVSPQRGSLVRVAPRPQLAALEPTTFPHKKCIIGEKFVEEVFLALVRTSLCVSQRGHILTILSSRICPSLSKTSSLLIPTVSCPMAFPNLLSFDPDCLVPHRFDTALLDSTITDSLLPYTSPG